MFSFFCPKAQTNSTDSEGDDDFDRLLYVLDPDFRRDIMKAREKETPIWIPPKQPLPPIEEDE